jgi:hypothetical protein
LCEIWLGTSPPFIDTDQHSEHAHICNRAQLWSSPVSWDAWAHWPWEPSLWLSWTGTCLTYSVKPNSWHSACWCSAVFGSPCCLPTIAPRGRSQWLWWSSPSCPPVQGCEAASLSPSAVLFFLHILRDK